MHFITSGFVNVVLVLVSVFALVQAFYYFRFKRTANVTDLDKSLWQLKLFSGFLAALLFLAMLYLPSTGIYRDIDLSPATRETAFQNLVHNQQSIGTQLDELREVLSVVFMMLMFYLFGIGIFIGRVWHERQKRAFPDDPTVKKPLGLEL